MKFKILPFTRSHTPVKPDGPGAESIKIWDFHGLNLPSELAAQPTDGELQQRRGHWSRIVASPEQVVLYTDHSLSFPLYYRQKGDTWLVADNINQLAIAGNEAKTASGQNIAVPQVNTDAYQEIRNCGHTLSDHTLFQGIYTVPAGSQVVLKPSGARVRCWVKPLYSGTLITDAADLSKQFDQALRITFGRVVAASQGRQLVVPLSGGIDSRLLLLYLLELGAENIVAFTYGKTGSKEMQASQAVAEKLGVAWHGVETDPGLIAKAWHSTQGDAFIRDTWSGFALPHVQDWWALRQLLQQGVISRGDLVLPGHTVVGSMHSEEVLETPGKRGRIAQAIAQHYWHLEGQGPQPGRQMVLLRQALGLAQQQIQWEVSTQERGLAAQTQTHALLEWFDISHRQSKYINNSMRGYEHFGLNWALPMLDTEVWQVWFSADNSLTVTRDWYRQFTDRLWEERTGEKLAYFTPSNTPLPSGLKRCLLGVMRKTGGDRGLSKIRSIRTQLNHPMAFEAFCTGYTKPRLAFELLRGRKLLGIWSELLLENRWGSGEKVLPE